MLLKHRKPHKHDERIRRCFALFPVRVSIDTIIWFRFYWVFQSYRVANTWDGTDRGWATTQWYDEGRGVYYPVRVMKPKNAGKLWKPIWVDFTARQGINEREARA